MHNIERRLDNIEHALSICTELLLRVLQKENINMSMNAQELALLSRAEVATTKASERLDAEIAKLVAAGQSDPAVIARMQALADHLEEMGKSPADPFPPLPPAAG